VSECTWPERVVPDRGPAVRLVMGVSVRGGAGTGRSLDAARDRRQQRRFAPPAHGATGPAPASGIEP
jgi:hypothetical protein